MEITILPRDLSIDTSAGLQLYNYRTYQDIQKTKISLSKNTISFLRTGTKEVIGDDKRVQIDEQQFVVMKSGNCLMTEKVSNANQFYQSILLFFSDEQAVEFVEKHELHSSKKLDRKSFHVFKYDQFIQHFVESLESISALPKATQSKLLKAKFEEIMLYLSFQKDANFLHSLVQNKDDKVGRLSNIVENNKYNKLSLEELAFLCNMSISTFKRTFFKQYGKTPMKWFNEQRMNHIAFLLTTQRKRPIELYMEAGYENFSNFVQAFKKEFGMTPKQYQSQS
jgi:AraC-like DNA-binding protein